MAKTVEIGPYSAYALAVAAGFVGTEEEWLKSLIGPQGEQGASITDVKINGEGHIIVTVHDPVSGEDSTIDAGDIGTVEAVEGVNAAIRQAAEQAVAAVTAQQATSVGAVQAAQSTGVQAVQQAQSTATGVVGDAQTSAVQAVNNARDEALSQVETSTEAAEQAKDAAASSAAAAAGSATDAAASKTAAATSATQAAEAKTGADSAKAAAETAQQAAESAKDSAEVAQSKAEQAETNAQSAAGEIDAGLIVETASGETITIRDSAAAKLRGLRLYGKSVQDGTPTPEAPVEIENAGDGGDITTLFRGNNLLSNDFVPKILSYTADSLTKTDYGVTFDVISTAGTIGGVYLDRVLDNMPKVITVSLDIIVSSLDFSSFRFGTDTDYKNVMSSEMTPNQPKHVAHTIVSDTNDVGTLTLYFSKASGNSPFSVNISNIMVSAGTKDYPFEPYVAQTLTYPTPNGLPGIPVESGGNFTDAEGQQWYCDIVDFAAGTYTKNVDYVDLKNYTFTLNSTWTNQSDTLAFAYAIVKYNQKTIGTLCNKLVYTPWNSSSSNYGEYQITVENTSTNNTTIYVVIPKTEFSGEINSSAVNNYLSTAGIYALLPLETPIETDLAPEQLAAYAALTTYKPNTTITTDSDPAAGVEVNYVADTKTYIDNKLAAISEAILGGTTNGNV